VVRCSLLRRKASHCRRCLRQALPGLMPQVWIPTLKRRLMLRTLDFFAQLSGSRSDAAAVVEQVASILVVEPKNIGDVVLAIPFLAQLRARFPKAAITLLAAPH